MDHQADRLADLDFAKVDLDRKTRCGLPEVIYAPGKTDAQVLAIAGEMIARKQHVMITRCAESLAKKLKEQYESAVYEALSGSVVLYAGSAPEKSGCVAIVCAGTSDLSVAHEARMAAEFAGAEVDLICDVGVAGIHRLNGQMDRIRSAHAVIVVAGMEGALPSVIGGLIDKPMIALPTSTGYGLNMDGLTSLLAMLNSCVAGITVVNVDNGFGAGIAAAKINRLAVGRNGGTS